MASFKKLLLDDDMYQTGDNIYLDVVVRNLDSTTWKIPAVFNQRRNEAFLDNPYDYYLSVVRWSLPAFSFPIALMYIQPNQPDPNLSVYSVTLSFDGDTQKQNIIFESRTNLPTPVDAIPVQRKSEYYFIYQYQHMVDMVNTALATAFSNLATKPAGSEAPYFIYNPVTKLFSLIAQAAHYDAKMVGSIQVYLNSNLFELFNGLVNIAEFLSNGRDFKILISNYRNNYYNDPAKISTIPPEYYETVEQFVSIPAWNAVKKITFETSLIPIQNEYTPASGNSFKKIMTDFEPLNSSSEDVRTSLQYFPQGQYRLIDLTGTTPLYNIDLKVTWLDVFGRGYTVQINHFQELSVKLLFTRKTVYKNYTDKILHLQKKITEKFKKNKRKDHLKYQ